MLPGLTPVHLLVLLVVALLVFGPTKLPELARQVGSAVNVYREFRDRMQRELTTNAIVDSLLEPSEPATPAAQPTEES